MAREWTRTEGMMIVNDATVDDVVSEFADRGVLADIEWFDTTPSFIGVTLAVSGGRAAVLPAGEHTPVEGPELTSLVQELADLFEAEVRIGPARADRLRVRPEQEERVIDATEDIAEDEELAADGTEPVDHTDTATDTEGTAPADDELDGTDDLLRVVEIGTTPVASLPLLAAVEDTDIADLATRGGQRALLAAVDPAESGTNFGDLPLVSIQMEGDELRVLRIVDTHVETVVTHNWAMRHRLVPGGWSDESGVSAEVIDLVGSRPELREIAAAVDGADVEAFVRAAALPAEEAASLIVTAFGLPSEAADFLRGDLDLDAVPGARLHRRGGLSGAIGRSVDLLLQEPRSEETHPVWEAYETFLGERPWLARVGVSIEAAAGATLVALSLRGARPKSASARLSRAVGALLVIDSVAEISARLLSTRLRRR